MGDHNDITFIFERGMAHSILYLSGATPLPKRATVPR